MKSKRYINWFMAVAVMGIGMVSCEDEPDKFELSGGKPTIKYIRMPSASAADSLIVGAFMDAAICLVGDNLKSIQEMYFNDQKAILNTSYMTENTLIVNVPGTIPEVVYDKIFMVTRDKDTINYDFKVLVPGPTVSSMKCEWVNPGELAEIRGDYFIDDPGQPLTLKIGDTSIDISNFTKNTISFVVPENLAEGAVEVTTIYGEVTSKFHYNDTRGMMFDNWGAAGETGTGLTNHGWHARDIKKDEFSLSGSYMELGGTTMSADGGWADGNFAFEYWPGDWSTPPVFAGTDICLNDLVNFTDFANMALKFEMCIPASNPWMAGAMQIIFSGNDQVTIQTANNTFFNNDTGYPRALYRPWSVTGSYDTADEWITVTLPIASSFIYDHNGTDAKIPLTEANFTGLTIFVWSGGVNGTECNPVIKIDNIRAVPNK
ncbi:glycan-binding surface protein [Bacteroides sp. UBA939]|uniref:glycan-binding surface protein n=1 Tax=Bacteroides sp. UBA939 TaxID=1946092 RepID=UPI0025C4F2C6|nr:glycan-binding surface protein [Bacteroides sp. UBA939]